MLLTCQSTGQRAGLVVWVWLFLFAIGFWLGALAMARVSRLQPYEWNAVLEARKLKASSKVQVTNAELDFAHRIYRQEDLARLKNGQFPIFCKVCIESYPHLCITHATQLYVIERDRNRDVQD